MISENFVFHNKYYPLIAYAFFTEGNKIIDYLANFPEDGGGSFIVEENEHSYEIYKEYINKLFDGMGIDMKEVAADITNCSDDDTSAFIGFKFSSVLVMELLILKYLRTLRKGNNEWENIVMMNIAKTFSFTKSIEYAVAVRPHVSFVKRSFDYFNTFDAIYSDTQIVETLQAIDNYFIHCAVNTRKMYFRE